MARSKVQLDKYGRRILTKEQRQRVYARALETFKKHVKNVIDLDKPVCNGMCEHVNQAVTYLRLDRYHTVPSAYNKKAWPEYTSFQPKTGWKENTSFWLTRRIKANGHTKRIAILEACAAGKSKGE